MTTMNGLHSENGIFEWLDNCMNKICQKQLLIEYMCRYGRNLPDERMLEIIDMDVMEEFGKEVTEFCKQIGEDFMKRGDGYKDVLYR